eukprot:TRINITY_DN11693_c0_g1_i1.p1 TRINITY_DN11693_c0_g1~~TRINITY_DN11693_c0_g1_i1.p1  ORF type:complete len:424 (-),score=125.75 TRINITY_DN11693_c0_g1_i1:136-1407(-)
MGSGASTPAAPVVSTEAVKAASVEEIVSVLASLGEDERKKCIEAAKRAEASSMATAEAVPLASVELFGSMPSGEAVHKVNLQTTVGGKCCGASIITRGATVQAVSVPDASGCVEDVVLGFDDLAGYNGTANFCYGGTPGRYANRIANGAFTLDGQEIKTTANWEGASGKKHCLHGGAGGFDGKVWSIAKGPWVDKDGAHVTMAYTAADGEEGFPGKLEAKVTYSWTAAMELKIVWEATSDKTTVCNLTNHSYFNLSGVKTASQVLDTHTVTLNCDKYTEVNEDAIPSGTLLDVAGTCMDFREPKLVGKEIANAQGGGYDHNWVVNGAGEGKEVFVGKVECTSGRILECYATQPGVQFFTMQPGVVFDKTTHGKGGQVYPVHGGLCLETQHFPDSPNQASFPSTTLTPDKAYREACTYKFSVKA